MKGKAPASVIFREPPIVAKSTAYPLTFDWNFLAAAGSLVLYACIVAWLLMIARRRPVNFLAVYARTIRQLALPIVTIAFILAINATRLCTPAVTRIAGRKPFPRRALILQDLADIIQRQR